MKTGGCWSEIAVPNVREKKFFFIFPLTTLESVSRDLQISLAKDRLATEKQAEVY